MFGGEGGIRTLDTVLPYTHFPGVLLQPLGHFSKICTSLTYFEPEAKLCFTRWRAPCYGLPALRPYEANPIGCPELFLTSRSATRTLLQNLV